LFDASDFTPYQKSGLFHYQTNRLNLTARVSRQFEKTNDLEGDIACRLEAMWMCF